MDRGKGKEAASAEDKRAGHAFGRANMAGEDARMRAEAGRPRGGSVGEYAGSAYAEQVMAEATASGRGVAFKTPFGSTTYTQSGGAQPRVSTRKEDYPDSKKRGDDWLSYSQWAAVADAADGQRTMLATDMLGAMKHGADYKLQGGYDPRTQRAAASLVTTMMTAEEWRVDGTRKMGRGALTSIAKGEQTFRGAFAGREPGYPMAMAPGGTAHTRAVMTGDEGYSGSERLTAAAMSPPQAGYGSDGDGSA